MARRIKGGLKRRETDVASNQFPVFPTAWNTQRVTELGREEKGEGGAKVTWCRKRRVKRGEKAIQPVISLPSKNGY